MLGVKKLKWFDEEGWGYVREALFLCLGAKFWFSTRQPWKFELRLMPCGQCSGAGRQRRVSVNDAEYYLRLQEYGAVEYRCLVCNDFGELWHTKDDRVFRIGTLPLRVPGEGA